MIDSSDNLQFYCQRILNPFRGTVSVVEITDARAISQDGRDWQIQVKTAPPADMWGGIAEDGKTRFFRFGNWSREGGLGPAPINPILDARSMVRRAEALAARLQQLADTLPFPFDDRYELWLLDGAEQRPLALMDSTSRLSALGALTPSNAHWKSVPLGEFGFVSRTLEDAGIPNRDDYSPCRHAEALNSQVMHYANPYKRLQWFARLADGSGSAVTPGDESASDSDALSSTYFPALPLILHWKSAQEQALIDDYFDWLAPRLLLLELPDELRDRFERAATSQPSEVERLWRLYPKTLNEDLLIAARVEAKIRKSR